MQPIQSKTMHDQAVLTYESSTSTTSEYNLEKMSSMRQKTRTLKLQNQELKNQTNKLGKIAGQTKTLCKESDNNVALITKLFNQQNPIGDNNINTFS